MKQAKYFNRNRRNIMFKVGDLVLRRNRACQISTEICRSVYHRTSFVAGHICFRDVNGNKTTKVHVKDL